MPAVEDTGRSNGPDGTLPSGMGNPAVAFGSQGSQRAPHGWDATTVDRGGGGIPTDPPPKLDEALLNAVDMIRHASVVVDEHLGHHLRLAHQRLFV